MNWKPKNWVVVVLNLISPPLGLLYIGNWRWALIFFASLALLATVNFIHVLGSGFDSIFPFLQIVSLLIGMMISFKIVKKSNFQTRPWYSNWYWLLAISVSAVFVALIFRIFLCEPFRIPSTSMEPTLEVGSRVLVKKLGYGHYSTYGFRIASKVISMPLHRGDIIVFDYPRDIKQTYIKRIVGLPGDSVVYRSGHLYVNGFDSQVHQLEDYRHQDGQAFLSRRFQNRLDGVVFDTLLDNDRPIGESDIADFPNRDRCAYSIDEIRCEVPPENYFVLGDNRDNSADSRHWGFVKSEYVIGKVIEIFQ